jgi:PAS domain-containing protein
MLKVNSKLEHSLVKHFFVGILLIVVVYSYLSIGALHSGIARVENNKIEQIGQRVIDALEIQFEFLDQLNLDYANWTELYNRLESSEPLDAFFEQEIAHLSTVTVSQVVLFDKYGRELQSATHGNLFFDVSWFSKEIEMFSNLGYGHVKYSSPIGNHRIYLRSNNEQLIWNIVRPVYDSNGNGKLRGYMMFARQIDYKLREKISRLFEQEIALEVLDSVHIAFTRYSDLIPQLTVLEEKENSFDGIFALNARSEGGDAMRLTVSASKPTHLYHQVYLMKVIEMVLIIMTITALMIFLRIRLTRPIANMSSWLQRYSQLTREELPKFDYSKDDELSLLASNIQKMHQYQRKAWSEQSQILNSISDYMFKINEAGVVTYCSPSCAEWFGLDTKQIVGQSLDFLLQSDVDNNLNSCLSTVFSSQETCEKMGSIAPLTHTTLGPVRQVTFSRIKGSDEAIAIIRR